MGQYTSTNWFIEPVLKKSLKTCPPPPGAKAVHRILCLSVSVGPGLVQRAFLGSSLSLNNKNWPYPGHPNTSSKGVLDVFVGVRIIISCRRFCMSDWFMYAECLANWSLRLKSKCVLHLPEICSFTFALPKWRPRNNKIWWTFQPVAVPQRVFVAPPENSHETWKFIVWKFSLFQLGHFQFRAAVPRDA